MKTFAINLKQHKERREHILGECHRLSINMEIIEGTDGKALSDEYLKSIVHDFPDCFLTKAEVGCVLSHQRIYNKMIDENIKLALILEDDALLQDNVIDVLKEIENIDNNKKPCAYLLTKAESYMKNRQLKSRNYCFFKVDMGRCANGYVLNKKAAQKLLTANHPIIWEADMWSFFHMLYGLKIYCILPHMIDTKDTDKNDSYIESERKCFLESRENYINIIKRNVKYYRIKKFIYHGLIKPCSQITPVI